MAEIRSGQVIDALIANLAAAPGFRLPSATTTGTTIWDGPQWGETEDHAFGAHLVIGWGGETRDAQSPSVSSTWEAGPIAATVRPRDETTQISCAVIAQNGDTPKEVRDLVLGALTSLGQILRTNPNLGVDSSATIGGVTLRTTLTAGSLTQKLERGYVAIQEFTVTYQGRV